MKKIFVSYKLAFLLREKGFNEPCLTWCSDSSFDELDVIGNLSSVGKTNSNLKEQDYHDLWCTIPTYTQVLDWFIKKHNRSLNYYPSDRAKTIREIEENIKLIS